MSGFNDAVAEWLRNTLPSDQPVESVTKVDFNRTNWDSDAMGGFYSSNTTIVHYIRPNGTEDVYYVDAGEEVAELWNHLVQAWPSEEKT